MHRVPAWEESGLVTEDGRLHRSIRSNAIFVPDRIEAIGDRLIWNNGGKGRWTRPGPGLLEQFVDLTQEDAPAPRAIEAYARRWGVLEICEHALPRTHNPRRQPSIPRLAEDPGAAGWQPWQDGCYPLGYVPFGVATPKGRTSPHYECWEPLRSWARVSRRARALLNIAARLHGGARGPVEDWHLLLGGDETIESWSSRRKQTELSDDHIRRYYGSRLNEERSRLSGQLNDWLELGNVRPVLTWAQQGPELRTWIHGLFGAIALQLVLAVARTEALAICSHCARSYLPKRKPVEGKRRYCDECRTNGIPMRDAMADRRARKQEESAGVQRGKTR